MRIPSFLPHAGVAALESVLGHLSPTVILSVLVLIGTSTLAAGALALMRRAVIGTQHVLLLLATALAFAAVAHGFIWGVRGLAASHHEGAVVPVSSPGGQHSAK